MLMFCCVFVPETIDNIWIMFADCGVVVFEFRISADAGKIKGKGVDGFLILIDFNFLHSSYQLNFLKKLRVHKRVCVEIFLRFSWLYQKKSFARRLRNLTADIIPGNANTNFCHQLPTKFDSEESHYLSLVYILVWPKG